MEETNQISENRNEKFFTCSLVNKIIGDNFIMKNSIFSSKIILKEFMKICIICRLLTRLIK